MNSKSSGKKRDQAAKSGHGKQRQLAITGTQATSERSARERVKRKIRSGALTFDKNNTRRHHAYNKFIKLRRHGEKLPWRRCCGSEYCKDWKLKPEKLRREQERANRETKPGDTHIQSMSSTARHSSGMTPNSTMQRRESGQRGKGSREEEEEEEREKDKGGRTAERG